MTLRVDCLKQTCTSPPTHPTVTHNVILSLRDYHEKHYAPCLDHTYIIYNGHIYKQEVGIPMGLEPAVFMACLTLMYYEYLFFEQLIASLEYKLLAYFAHCSRYIDDICALHCTHLKQLKYQVCNA